MKGAFLCVLFLTPIWSALSQNPDTLYIRSGTFFSSLGGRIPTTTFSASKDGEAALPGPVLRFVKDVALQIQVFNADSIEHGFAIRTEGRPFVTMIPPNESRTVNLSFSEPGVYLYHDPIHYPRHQSIGLFGAIIVEDGKTYDREYLWLLSEHDSTWMTSGIADVNEYWPDYFTINGKSQPDIQTDPSTHIIGRVGQTIRIRVLNAGLMWHSLHFHGYHLALTRRNNVAIDPPMWKDTIPIRWGESMELLLTPDQPGKFPVHDHNNLAGEIGGGQHHNGMLDLMEVQP